MLFINGGNNDQRRDTCFNIDYMSDSMGAICDDEPLYNMISYLTIKNNKSMMLQVSNNIQAKFSLKSIVHIGLHKGLYNLLGYPTSD